MNRYTVKSGDMNLTVEADGPVAAAVAAVKKLVAESVDKPRKQKTALAIACVVDDADGNGFVLETASVIEDAGMIPVLSPGYQALRELAKKCDPEAWASHPGSNQSAS